MSPFLDTVIPKRIYQYLHIPFLLPHFPFPQTSLNPHRGYLFENRHPKSVLHFPRFSFE